jgi:hypothetical protein
MKKNNGSSSPQSTGLGDDEQSGGVDVQMTVPKRNHQVMGNKLEERVACDGSTSKINARHMDAHFFDKEKEERCKIFLGVQREMMEFDQERVKEKLKTLRGRIWNWRRKRI